MDTKQSRVIKIIKTFSNSAIRVPTAYGQLDCGHGCQVVEVPSTAKCEKCNHTQLLNETGGSKCNKCGRGGLLIVKFPNPHCDADLITKVGDVVECQQCTNYANTMAKLMALKPGDVQHARFRPYDSRGGSEGAYHVYKRDPKSPTGVTLMFSIDATKEADAILSKLQASPLSPTEGR